MIRATHLSLRRGVKLLLDDVSTVVNPGEKVGLVGANGSGKSTLFALLQRALQPDQGDLSIPPGWRVAHVAQETVTSERSALDFVVDGDRRLRELEAAIAAASAAPASAPAPTAAATPAVPVDDEQALAELHMAYGDAGGYTAASRGETLLFGLGFTLEEARRPVVTFSGGWRMRLQLAQALMTPSDLLLLDEPTNHLDLDAIVWLEQWLRRYPGTLIVISHDREFLDAVCDTTLSLEHRKLVRWTGNYSAFELQRAERLRLAAGAYAKQRRDIAHLQHFVDRFKAKATKAKQAQSRVKAMERMTLLAPVIEASPFTFRFRAPESSPDPMLLLDAVDCGYRVDRSDSDAATGGGDATADRGVRTVVRQMTLRLTAGERIGLLGANGQGKSTVVKTIAGTLDRLGGTMTAGKGLAIGYFAQHQVDMLDRDASPLLQLARVAAAARPGAAAPREQELRDYLGSFDFRGDMATSSVAPFSGGEKARLALALIIWTRPNLLLLDEPTNHLDLETREALTLALAQFEGALILVSHDRALLRATTDRFLLVDDGRCVDFDGDLDDYRAWSLKKTAGRERTAGTDGAAQGAAPAAAKRSNDGPTAATPTVTAMPTEAKSRDQRRQDATARDATARRRKPIEQRIRRIEAELAEAESRKRAVEAALASPDAYDDAHRERLTQLLIDQAYVARDIERLEGEWMEQQTLLERAA